MTSGSEWAEQARRLMESLRAAGPAAGERTAAAGSDCRWCPLCQAAAVVRGERPEVTAALADILSTAAAALRQFADEPAGSTPGAGPQPSSDPASDERAAAVQRIELA